MRNLRMILASLVLAGTLAGCVSVERDHDDGYGHTYYYHHYDDED